MEIKLDVHMINSETNIKFDDNQSAIKISDINNFEFNANQSAIYFLLNDNDVRYIGKTIDNSMQKDKTINKVITILIPLEINLEYLEYVFIEEAIKNEITLTSNQTTAEPKISKKQKDEINEYKDKILFILKNFGYKLVETENGDKLEGKPHPTKARHKWSKEISQIKFTAKSIDGEGQAIWQKKDELVLLSGAKLVINPQMNKDGSINFSAQFAQKLRSDYSDKIVDNFTTEDIVFPSPNTLGMFLFFGGQNTWAQLKDSSGKSLDDWSRVG